MIVRSCRYSDLEELVDLMAAFSREESKRELINRKDSQRNVLTGLLYSLDSEQFEVFVVENNGELLGYTLVNRNNSDYPESLVIEETYIRPEYRGKGLAGVLTKKVEEYAKSLNIRRVCSQVREENNPNLRSKHKLGYEIKGRKQGFVVLERELDL